MKHLFYVLVDKATEHTFPRHRGNVSYVEFTDELPPRLFMRHQDALHTARWWCQGFVYQTREQHNDEYDSFQMTVKPVEGRSLDNIEIRTVALLAVPS